VSITIDVVINNGIALNSLKKLSLLCQKLGIFLDDTHMKIQQTFFFLEKILYSAMELSNVFGLAAIPTVIEVFAPFTK
jgi:hypothetical protein